MKDARRWRPSLRARLMLATAVTTLLALVLAGLLLASLFREHVMGQFRQQLVAQLDQLTARLDIDASGHTPLEPRQLSDPRWSRPYSGLYWQIDGPATHAGGASQAGIRRSRSLWDTVLAVQADALADGEVHTHAVEGPNHTPLLLVERSVRTSADSPPWRLLVAADLRETQAAVHSFTRVLALSLAGLWGLLTLATLAQLSIGLAPLRALQRSLGAVRESRAAQLEGPYPTELQPLVDDFNAVLARNTEIVTRARTQAGNLAHAVKTPLAVMDQAAQRAAQDAEAAAELPGLVQQQVALARRHVDWHLARSRAAAAAGLPGTQVAVAPVLSGLLRVLERLHRERGVVLRSEVEPAGCRFAGEGQDLQEILGNVLDNACQWARHEVAVSVTLADGPRAPQLRVVIDDDGPGIDPSAYAQVMTRGARLDESVPGSGLGLAIVGELVSLYGGHVSLGPAPLGGLRVTLTLPAR